MTVYVYGMRLRGCAPGCQPKQGFIERRNDTTGRYHDIVIYDRDLSTSELFYYVLDYLGKEQIEK